MKIGGIYIEPVPEEVSVRAFSLEPYGLERILAIAKEAGHEVRIFCLDANNLGEMLEELKCYSPEVLVFSIMTYEANKAAEIVKEIKNAGIDSLVVAGGAHPSADPHYLLKNGFDICARGEGELIFREVLGALRSRDFNSIAGISFHSAGRIIDNPSRERIENLDLLPWAVRDETFIRQCDFGLYPPRSRQEGVASLEYSRGCAFRCLFCDSPEMWGQKITYRSARNVLREIKNLKQEHGVNTIFFTDLNFTANKRKVLELCEELLKEKPEIYWRCQSNVITGGDKEMLSQMRKAGCGAIYWGLESVAPRTLQEIKKSHDTEIMENTLRMSASFGIVNHGFYIIGFPWETKDSILVACNILPLMKIHRLRVTIATPLPNSDWFRDLKPDDLMPEYLDKADTNHLVYKHPCLSGDELRDIQGKILRSFYLSEAYGISLKELFEKNPLVEESFPDYFQQLPYRMICDIIKS